MWIYKWMDRHVDRYMDGQIEVDRYMDGQTKVDRYVDRWMDE